MSEIQNPLARRNFVDVGSNRRGEWQTMRLVVHRNSTDWLTYAVIETSWTGRSAMDSRFQGGQVLWTPEDAAPLDLRLYALRRALWSAAQTIGQ